MRACTIRRASAAPTSCMCCIIADKPEIYSNLPKDPKISAVVEAWKGVTKYAGMASIGAFAVLGFFHYVLNGPNRVTGEDEENAEDLRRDS